MAARLWTALLLLAAVLTVHGLQCTGAAADGTAHTPALAAPMTGSTGDPEHLTAAALGGLMAGEHAVPAPAVGDHAVGLPGALLLLAGHGGPPHDAAAHLWTVCLAVLAVALAVLLALLGPRLVRLAPLGRAHARARAAGWLTPTRPPDLSVLCILRT